MAKVLSYADAAQVRIISISQYILIGMKPQEDFFLWKNGRSAVGARVGQSAFGGRLSEVGSRHWRSEVR